MREACIHWIRLLIVSAFIFGGGAGVALAHPSSPGPAYGGHEPGIAVGETASAVATDDHGCGPHGHLTVCCTDAHCCASAVPLFADRFTLSAPTRDRFAERDDALRYGQLFYPLLRPPTATA